jgi:ABC-2 type transport system permease protein
VRVDRDLTTEKNLEVIDLLRSSAKSWTDDDTSRVGYVDYEVPEAGLEPQLLAVALDGQFESYFAGKEAPAAEDTADDGGDEATAPPGAAEVPLERSPETRLVVIGDAEFLSDFVARALGTTEGGFFDENLAFMQNLIDWINLDSDLIGIRSRSTGARRLDRVERGTEVTIEAVNYAAPAVFLVALGAWLFWRRRSAVPVISTAPARPDAAARRTTP